MENRRLDKKEASEIFLFNLTFDICEKMHKKLDRDQALMERNFFLTKFQKTLYFNQSEKSF